MGIVDDLRNGREIFKTLVSVTLALLTLVITIGGWVYADNLQAERERRKELEILIQKNAEQIAQLSTLQATTNANMQNLAERVATAAERQRQLLDQWQEQRERLIRIETKLEGPE